MFLCLGKNQHINKLTRYKAETKDLIVMRLGTVRHNLAATCIHRLLLIKETLGMQLYYVTFFL